MRTQEVQEVTRSLTEINKAIAWQLKQSIGADRFDLWFSDPQAIALQDDAVVISTSDELSRSFIRQQFGTALQESIRAVLGTDASLRYTVNTAPLTPQQNSLFTEEQLADVGIPKLAENDKRKRRRRNVTESPAPVAKPFDSMSLDAFHFGAANRLLETAVSEVLTQPGRFSPLVLHGPVGCGKSHLVRGLISSARQSKHYRRCVNVTSEQFTSNFIEALQAKQLVNFRAKFRNLDLLAIDDIQFLVGKQATLVEFQNTLETLSRMGKQVILTCDRPVQELRIGEESVVTRLSCGLACPVSYPDLDGRMNIIRALAGQRKMNLKDDVIRLIAESIGRDVRMLSGAINRLSAAALSGISDLDMQTTSELLGDLFVSQSPVVSLAKIEAAVCDVCGVDAADLKSGKRIRTISTARMLAMWLSRKYTSAGLAEIGKHYGGRSHSTVVAAQKKIDKLLANDAIVDLRARRSPISSAVDRLKQTLEVA